MKKEPAREIFNSRFSLYYERVINKIASPLIVNRWRKFLIEESLKIVPTPKRVADLCSGAGNIYELFPLKGKITFINLDASLPLLNLGREKFKETYFVRCDNKFLPLKGESIEVLFSSFCVRNSTQPLKTVKEVYRVLKPNGVWAILDFFPPKNGELNYRFNFFWFKIFMKIHSLLSLQNKEAIDYLFGSIKNFYKPEEFLKILSSEGFEVIRAKPFMGGVAWAIILQKWER